jgi:hypothetical protein
MTEGATDEGAPTAEAEQADIEEEDVDEEEEDYNTLILTKTQPLGLWKIYYLRGRCAHDDKVGLLRGD